VLGIGAVFVHPMGGNRFSLLERFAALKWRSSEQRLRARNLSRADDRWLGEKMFLGRRTRRPAVPCRS
jgi:hypothetical protein